MISKIVIVSPRSIGIISIFYGGLQRTASGKYITTKVIRMKLKWVSFEWGQPIKVTISICLKLFWVTQLSILSKYHTTLRRKRLCIDELSRSMMISSRQQYVWSRQYIRYHTKQPLWSHRNYTTMRRHISTDTKAIASNAARACIQPIHVFYKRAVEEECVRCKRHMKRCLHYCTSRR